MKARLLVVLAVLVLAVGTVSAQTVVHQDVRPVLQAAAKAMGVDSVKTLTITGNGTTRAFGQAYVPPSFSGNSPDEDFPVLEMASYTRVIDYDARFSREELVRRQGNNPQRGGGGIPIQGDQRQISVNSGNFSWNVNADNSVAPQPALAEQRLIEIVLTPHGFIKAAMEAKDATAVTMMMSGDDPTIGKNAGPAGRKVTFIAFTTMGKYRVSGSLDDQNLVERTQTYIGNPVMGDLFWQWDYTNYRDMAGIKFPGVLHAHWGDIRAEPHHGIEIRVSNIELNKSVDAAARAVPDAVRKATAQPVRAEASQLAPGIWKIGGGSHHSIAVDFKDHIAVIEAPQNEERSLAAIREIQRVIPNKPIRYVVMTHHHFDHSGGIRTYVAHGAIIVTHAANREFLDRHVLGHAFPRTVQPDIMSTYYPRFAADRLPVFETINPRSAAGRSKYVLSDGDKSIELYAVTGLNHTSDMLIAYLPKEKILINADLFSPPAAGAKPPAPNQSMTALRNNITRLRLDVARHVGIHGDTSSHEEFMKIVGTGGGGGQRGAPAGGAAPAGQRGGRGQQ
jgi:glyoxylase-like metal-dependent hydrolase (beta-lactamase superfamily II)